MDIGAIIGAGFHVIRNKPLAFMAWSLVLTLLFAGMTPLMRPMIAAQIQAMSSDSPVQVVAFGAMPVRLLLSFLLLFLICVGLFAASLRAVLQPERQAVFYIRVGMDELRLLTLTIVFVAALCTTVFALMAALGVLIAITMGVTGASRSGALALSMGLIDIVAIAAFTVFYFMRLGLSFPLTLLRGKIVIGEAWRISRGRFWSLFVASFAVLIIIFLLWMAVASIASGAYFAEFARSGGNPIAMQKAAQAQIARPIRGLTGTALVIWVVGGIIGALTVTLWSCATATAVQQLTFDPHDIAKTFA